eukprot:CAMPEP_0201573724 /NCGR_PEP_ID=MMETSP0190_2-20130828/17731_1 /ASSEMBLY_ACC=CAM_ASM_000263 /TAXON_ID=37353 /ORGANISM="Rosalina sp." /LENGTH=421 /DNA_ID=CAMNT_0048001013 /DNA_START=370 /DNA_END=1635 /DNA_ORIENTATION=+
MITSQPTPTLSPSIRTPSSKPTISSTTKSSTSTTTSTSSTSKPSYRPTLLVSNNNPTKSISPTNEFHGAYFQINFFDEQISFNTTQQTQIIEILIEIINEIIHETVNDKECDTNIQFKADESTFNGTLFVCDETTERELMFVFESDGGIKQLERRLILEINEQIDDDIIIDNNNISIIIIIEDKIIRNTDIFITTKILNVAESKTDSSNDDHILYILIVSGVLVFAFFIGVIQYCRYERNEIKSQQSLVQLNKENNKNKENKMKMMGMHQMINVKQEEQDQEEVGIHFEPGQRHQMLPINVNDDNDDEEKKQENLIIKQNTGEYDNNKATKRALPHHTNGSIKKQGHNNILIDSDSEHHKTSSNEELLLNENEKRKVTESTETSIETEQECDNGDDESVIIEGDERVITRNRDIAIPETIK